MIFGRKRRSEAGADASDDLSVTGEGAVDGPLEDESDDLPAEVEPDVDDTDPRRDGPFDESEVDLEADEVERIAFGPLVLTPFEGLNVQLHGDPSTRQVASVLATYEQSGLELALFAAPTSGGLADEMREDLVEETSQAGGSADVAGGPFGPEVRRVLPLEGPEGEQLFHVSRIWLVDGPRWLLRGTLMGQAALVEGEAEPADIFVEFFRNIVVRRDTGPRVPGEIIQLAIPENTPRG